MDTHFWYVTKEGKEFIFCGSREDVDSLQWSGLMGPFKSESEALASHKVTGECACGSLISRSTTGATARKMAEKGCCFSCAFWWEKVEMSAEPKSRQLIINGHHYMVGDNKPGKGFYGCGGHRFTFIRNGCPEPEVCNDLWKQGEIPERFRELLPDNAIWATSEAIARN